MLVLQSGVDGREETDEPGDEGSIEGREGIGERPAGDGAAAEAAEGGRQWLRHGGKVASDASSIGWKTLSRWLHPIKGTKLAVGGTPLCADAARHALASVTVCTKGMVQSAVPWKTNAGVSRVGSRSRLAH